MHSKNNKLAAEAKVQLKLLDVFEVFNNLSIRMIQYIDKLLDSNED